MTDIEKLKEDVEVTNFKTDILIQLMVGVDKNIKIEEFNQMVGCEITNNKNKLDHKTLDRIRESVMIKPKVI